MTERTARTRGQIKHGFQFRYELIPFEDEVTQSKLLQLIGEQTVDMDLTDIMSNRMELTRVKSFNETMFTMMSGKKEETTSKKKFELSGGTKVTKTQLKNDNHYAEMYEIKTRRLFESIIRDLEFFKEDESEEDSYEEKIFMDDSDLQEQFADANDHQHLFQSRKNLNKIINHKSTPGSISCLAWMGNLMFLVIFLLGIVEYISSTDLIDTVINNLEVINLSNSRIVDSMLLVHKVHDLKLLNEGVYVKAKPEFE